jgi:hypothetical protein
MTSAPGSTFRLALVALLAFAASACATSGSTANPFSEGGRAESVRIEVLNLNFSDARLTALRDGRRTSLGIVGGKQEGQFTIPWEYPQELRIEINLLAGPTCQTEAMPVDPGDILELQITEIFSQSVCRW